MFVLDTNVLSAMMSAAPVPEVATWVSGQPAELLFTATVCQAEILSGLAIMPEGRRRLDLEAAARAMFAEDFEGRVLAFDMEAAVAYAEIFAARRWAGRPATTADLMIAAVARSQGASVVTRNVADFEACGVAIVNPWDAQPNDQIWTSA
jgi:toxin FitB